ncbi:MAG: hypothetical protein ACR2PX_04250, partial [Endozoicomonas sp.]|uniref:hypothetical protein n=1 Tax=Endozoicomonas sp. TaxID=1892382 RepID=UPI003D9B4ADA
DLLRLFYPSLVNSKKSKPYSVGFMHSGGEKPLSNQEITDSGLRENRTISEPTDVRKSLYIMLWASCLSLK